MIKVPEVLNYVDAPTNGEKDSGTSVKKEKKRAYQSCANANQSVEDSINATSLGLGERKGKKKKVISMGDNSAKGKDPVNSLGNTIKKVNHDKNIVVRSKKKVQNAPQISWDTFPTKVGNTLQSSWNTFPTNVRSLLSSGLLDGVPVKYISSSWENIVEGVIKDNGFLCGCDDCKLSKKENVICAMEFEKHADCKSGHANRHIYFDSGKTIYAVFQVLRNTSPEKLFEATQDIVGSPINPENFQTFRVARENHLAKNEVTKPF